VLIFDAGTHLEERERERKRERERERERKREREFASEKCVST
jgi:hypothetical protein